jgi:hypothetical protein
MADAIATAAGATPSTGEARGSCHCGRVRFVARFPSRFCCHCHCASCRRAHGAAFVTWIGFPSDQVTLEAGAADLVAHVSSPGTRRSFCRCCGTKLFFESVRWPGETHVALACFDDPVDRAPSGHAFFDEHVPWIPWPESET